MYIEQARKGRATRGPAVIELLIRRHSLAINLETPLVRSHQVSEVNTPKSK